MAVHIGSELKAQFEASGLTLKAFASRIGRSPKNLYEVFERPSVDTQLLRKASEVLRFNFFRLYAEDIEKEWGGTSSQVSEPAGIYQRSKPATVIVIQGDNPDPGLIERITKASKG